MRLVTQPFLESATELYPQSASWVFAFIVVARDAEWKSITEIRKQYPHADSATVASGRTVIIFNVAGNKYRLITAVHFNTGIVFTLKFLTHAECSKNQWKNDL